MAEFTGERVIPGLVDADLFNEHVSRYKFASRLIAPGDAVLDMGCGTGYGTAELTAAASITGIDVSAEAVAHARANYERAGVRFLEASCEAVPLEDHQFDLITAFEVIEHLGDYRSLLREARRLLKPGGQFVVSTPNRAYYAEARAASGPNPFHTREFEHAEFETALYEFFPHVRVWTQNHAGAIVFAPSNPAAATLESEGARNPEAAHFFVAVCGAGASGSDEVFAWIPQTGNVLRERELHIAKLEGELVKKDEWLRRSVEAHASLQREHEKTLEELLSRNRWAEGLLLQIAERNALIVGLQNEANVQLDWVRQLEARITDLETDLGTFQTVVNQLEADLGTRTHWGQSLQSQLDEKTEHVKILLAETDDLRATAGNLLAVVEGMKAERAQVANSKWMRLGRAINVGPVLPDSD